MFFNPVSDMILQINNNKNKFKKYFYIRYSILKFSILKILKIEKYINNFFIIYKDYSKFIIIELKYKYNISVITDIKIISKSNIKIFTKYKKFLNIFNNYGLFILSTNKGLITNKVSKKIGLGGKLILYVF